MFFEDAHADVVEVIESVKLVEVNKVVELVELVEIDCTKSMKLETSPKVTKSKQSLHWCRRSVKIICAFFITVSVKMLLPGTLSGRRFITVSGVFITLSGTYNLHYRAFLLHYRARINYSIGRL